MVAELKTERTTKSTNNNMNNKLTSNGSLQVRSGMLALFFASFVWWRREILVLGGIARELEKYPAQEESDTLSTVVGTNPKNISPPSWEPMPIQDLTRGNRPLPNCTAPYVPVHDVVVPGDPYLEADGTRRRIPRQIHLAWVSANEGAPRLGRCLHPLQLETFEKYQKNFPNYSIYFHDDDAVDTLLQQENFPDFPELAKMMKCAQMRGAMLVDLWRILVLYRYGGFYADMDLWPKEEFTEATIKPETDFFAFSDAWMRPTQMSFGMAPGHPVGYYNMHEIFKRIEALENIAHPRLVFVTGPEIFKYGYGQVFGWDNIKVNGILHGPWNTTAQKLAQKGKQGMKSHVDEKVDVNGTTMTYKEKIKADTGVLHWTQEIRVMPKRMPAVSCRQYLHELDRKQPHFPGNNLVQPLESQEPLESKES